MGRSRYKVTEGEPPYFMTCTVIQWIPLFSDSVIANILFDSLRFLQTNKRIVIYGYVIMENHLHLIAASPNLPVTIKEFKSFTARRIIDYLFEKKRHETLEMLRFFKVAHKDDSEYQVWQEGYHPEMIQDDSMLRQKLEYIHDNPVRRGYVEEAIHWRYSSARNYLGVGEPILELNGLVEEGES